MELHTRGRYAVMAMADLAKYGGGPAVALVQISERQNLPLAYLEQLFVKLRAAGLIESVRGRAGGYRLAQPAGAIAVADILDAVEEGTRMTRCGIEGVEGCVGNERCLTHGLWQALGGQIRGFLTRVTLDDVIADRMPSDRIGDRGGEAESHA